MRPGVASWTRRSRRENHLPPGDLRGERTRVRVSRETVGSLGRLSLIETGLGWTGAGSLYASDPICSRRDRRCRPQSPCSRRLRIASAGEVVQLIGGTRGSPANLTSRLIVGKTRCRTWRRGRLTVIETTAKSTANVTRRDLDRVSRETRSKARSCFRGVRRF